MHVKYRKTLLLGLLAGAYGLIVRPRLMNWGATEEEAKGPFPGAELIPGGVRTGTMGLTIDAPPEEIWPWLAQMGYKRAGWYSWDRLDNWGRHSAEQIHPEWQQLKVGDRLSAREDDRNWFEVAAVDPPHFLGLRASVDLRGHPFDPKAPRPRSYSDSLWGFHLKPLPGGRTRLLVSGYWAHQPEWLRPVANALLVPSHWIMQMRQFANLKRRVERGSKHVPRVA